MERKWWNKETYMEDFKLIINGEVHFFSTICKYLNYLLTITAYSPIDCCYKRINIRNNSLMKSMKISFRGERNARRFFVNNRLCTLSESGKRSVSCDLFDINLKNIFQLLFAIRKACNRYVESEAFEIFSGDRYLDLVLRNFCARYRDKNVSCSYHLPNGTIDYHVYVVQDNSEEKRQKGPEKPRKINL